MRRWALRLLLALTVISWAPVAVITATYAAALLAGCDPERGSLVHCLLPGLDAGGALNAVLITGWLMVVLAPLALVTACLWAVSGLVALWRGR